MAPASYGDRRRHVREVTSVSNGAGGQCKCSILSKTLIRKKCRSHCTNFSLGMNIFQDREKNTRPSPAPARANTGPFLLMAFVKHGWRQASCARAGLNFCSPAPRLDLTLAYSSSLRRLPGGASCGPWCVTDVGTLAGFLGSSYNVGTNRGSCFDCEPLRSRRGTRWCGSRDRGAVRWCIDLATVRRFAGFYLCASASAQEAATRTCWQLPWCACAVN